MVYPDDLVWGAGRGKIDPELQKKNIAVWNAWSCQALTEQQREKMLERAKKLDGSFDLPEAGAWKAMEAEVRGHLTTRTDGFTYENLPDVTNAADFSEIVFANGLSLLGAVFTQPVNFQSAKFIQTAHFRRTHFLEGAQFKSTVFEHEAQFRGSAFHQTADFERAQFAGRTNFIDALFSKGVNFRSTYFAQVTEFIESRFALAADFRRVRFAGDVDFMSTRFANGEFVFARFEGRANFVDVHFSSRANFNATYFAHLAEFHSAKFAQDANFNAATFADRVTFRDAKFGDPETPQPTLFNLTDAQFDKPASFRDAEFLNLYPDFTGAILHDKTLFPWGGENWPVENDQNARDGRDSCAFLRHHMAKQGLPEAEQFFYRREMAFAQRGPDRLQNLPYQLFGLLSGYGHSIARPVWAIFALWIVPALLFMCYFAWVDTFPQAYPDASAMFGMWDGFGFSFANIFKFFGFQRTYFGVDFIAALPASLKLLSALQTVFGFIFLFFLGLGLRSRFRLR